MKKLSPKQNMLIIIFLSVFFILLIPFFSLTDTNTKTLTSKEAVFSKKLEREAKIQKNLQAELVDPEQAPELIRAAVMLGYNIMLNTPKYASQYAGDKLSCTNCHFAAGNTTGGKNGSFSLVGVAAVYPRYDPKGKRLLNLASRINDCFVKSLNGKPLPLDSQEMLALETYLHWISKGTPIYKPVPWRGIPALQSKHKPNLVNGKEVYVKSCAMCHGVNGEGELENQIPPVWGASSFNSRAGLNVESIMASFLYYNMPYDDASLTEEEAIDVAAFLVNQPRP